MRHFWVARLGVAVAIVFAVWPAQAARAQVPESAAPPPRVATLTVAFEYDVRRDRLRYQFQNPSTIDTPFLVPHSFAQAYVADNQWIAVSTQYQVLRQRLASEYGFSREITATGTDFDTFHNPNNDIVITGTSGDVRLRSRRFAQWSESMWRGLPLRVGYVYRRDRSNFLPADVVLTHTNPPSESRRLTAAREQTVSQVHTLAIDLARPVSLSPRWQFVAGGTVSPLVLARLTTRLPDKYPGQDIVFSAQALEVEGRAQIALGDERWRVVWELKLGRTWSYAASRQFSHDAAQVSVKVGYQR